MNDKEQLKDEIKTALKCLNELEMKALRMDQNKISEYCRKVMLPLIRTMDGLESGKIK
jgi:hypothetical protein